MNDSSEYHGSGRERTLEEAIAEVDRELQVRKRCYSRWVDDGKMSSVDALDRFERLQTASVHLHKLQNLRETAEAQAQSS